METNPHYLEQLVKTLEEKNCQLQEEIKERQLLEKKLRNSEEKMRAVFEAMTDIVLVIDPDGSGIEVAPTNAANLGETSNELIEQTIQQFLQGENSEAWLNQIRQVLQTKQTINFDYNLLIDEREVWFTASISPMANNSAIWVARNITDRKQAEVALHQSEQKFAKAFLASPSAITITRLSDGCHVEANDSFCHFTGYTREEIIGHTAIELNLWVNWEDRNRLFNLLQNKRIIRNYEFDFRTKSGEIRTALLSAELINMNGQTCLITVSQDITERKRAEQTLRMTQFFLDNCGDGAYWIGADGSLLYVNNAACNYLGYTEEELLQMKVVDINPNFSEEMWHQSFQQQKQNRLPSIFETHHCRKDGTIFPVEVTARYLEFNGQEYLCAFSRDITVRKQAETALQEAKKAAENASRSKSEFLANMSHELRTPLNAILGFSQLMSRDTSLKREHKQHLEIINNSGEHLLSLINDILQMSKIESGRITLNENDFNLHFLLDNLQEMFRIKAENKGLMLIVDRENDLPQYIRIDESKLRQILINLLGNAIKFTSEGGITLRLKMLPHDYHSDKKLNPNQRMLLCEVEDTGPGIAAAELSKLFEPFAQTETGRKSQQGTGLGLPISSQFVQLMGGELTVNSRVDEGTTFRFIIPISLAETSKLETVKKTRQVIGLTAGQPEYRILVVDDRFESRLLLLKLLSSVGFQVREAENGQEAVEIWEHWQPHLIWMDMRMPVMDGYEATKRIKSHLKGQATVIVALTASALDEERTVVLSAGCDDFVRKPFREAVIFEKIAQYLGVNYIYRELFPSTSEANTGNIPGETTNSAFILTPSSLQIMPPDWLKELYQAADCVDNDTIFQLISQIPSESAPLANALSDLVNSFRCDKIIDLIERIEGDN